jgi:DNA polymerase elongation subunit (family B)
VLAAAGGGDPAHNDHIMSIALADKSGWEELIVVDPNNTEESERNAIRRLTALIKERDPDVIEGHDLFRVHLPLLVARAKKLKTKLDWGRSGGFLRSRPSRLQIAETHFCWRTFTTSGCALSRDSNGRMWLDISTCAIANSFLDLQGRNWNAYTLTIQNCSSDARCAVFVKRAHCRIC